MKNTLAILVNRFISLGCKILKPIMHKDGSVTPGYYASKINKDILNDIKYPKYVIGITGSSGKGSTTSLVAHILEGNGLKVVWNKSGSNLYNGAVTLILNNTNPFTKKLNADVLLMELDESFIKTIFNKNKLTHLVMTNITRDQPARNGTPDIIYNKIINSIDDSTHLIINADDPIVSRVKLTHKGKITTYGVAEFDEDYKTPISNTFDATYCPKCNSKLKYNYYHYGHIGNYECPYCDFKRGTVDYEATDINLSKQYMSVNGNLVHLNKDVEFCIYYTLAAYALCNTIELSTEQIQKELNDDVMESKRMKIEHINGRAIEMIESKNENALSYLQSIRYIRNKTGIKTVILGFENVSRRYSYNDLSWLYDVDFELLKDDGIDKIFCIGRFKWDVYTRLIYAGIDPNKLVLVDDINNLINMVLEQSTGNIFTMVCFDMTAIIKKLVSEVSHE